MNWNASREQVSEWISLVQGARLVRRHPITVRRLVLEGKVKACKVRGRVYVRREELLAQLDPSYQNQEEGASQVELGGGVKGMHRTVSPDDLCFACKEASIKPHYLDAEILPMKHWEGNLCRACEAALNTAYVHKASHAVVWNGNVVPIDWEGCRRAQQEAIDSM